MLSKNNIWILKCFFDSQYYVNEHKYDNVTM